MKTFVITSLLAAGIALSASNAQALSGSDLKRAIEAEDADIHLAKGKHHRARGCRFSHGRFICGGGRGRDHGRSNRGHGSKHGGNRH